MSMGVRSVIFDIIGKDNASRAFMSASRSAEKAATRLERSIGRINATGARFQAVGQKMSKSMTLPLVAAVAESVHQASKFQKSLNTIAVATDKTSGQMKQAGAGIKKIAVETGTNLEQMSASFYVAAKSGRNVADSLNIARAAAQGAKAESADLGIVTNALTSVLASYGNAIRGGPVGAMNMIVRGAGLAKTTIQDFSSSLSNVVPVAASLHVGFADVAAAIATMTQHGETAQHATENLRNLFTNLAGQNNVASQAMQQLGIHTVDLRKNLGKRGLVGTLDLVINAAKKATGKDGLIHVSNMKAASLATHSLNEMLGQMHGHLKTQSLDLLQGKTGISEYRKYARSLGGQLGPMGVQFLALYQNTKGFSNLLKTGNGTVMTYASALQKMLGGVTGMNVSLQVSGQSAKTFHQDAKNIAGVADHAGKNVLGWAKTQQLFSTQVDITKAKLQVLAVNIGTALLPYVQKIVGWIQKAVDWFGRLSGTQKSIAKWAIGIAIVIGPVLAIFGRIIRLFATFARLAVFGSRFKAGLRGAGRSMEVMGTGAYKSGMRVRSSLRMQATEAEITAAAMRRSAGQVATAEAAQTRAVVSNSERQVIAMAEVRAAAAMGAGGRMPVMLPMGGGVPLRPGGRLMQRGAPLMDLPQGTGIVPIGGGGGGRGLSPRLRRGLGMGAGLGLAMGAMLLGPEISGNAKLGSGRRTLGDTMSYAGTGAMLGSIAGPWGMGIGAGIGGVIGLMKNLSAPTAQDTQISAMNSALKALPAPTRKSIQDSAIYKRGTVTTVATAHGGTPTRGGGTVTRYTPPKEKDTKAAKHMVDVALATAKADRIASVAGNLWAGAIVTTGKASRTTAVDIAAAALSHTDLVKAGQQVGFTQKDLTNAITGTNAQYERTVNFWKQFGRPTAEQLHQLKALRDAWKGSGKAAIATAIAQGKTVAGMSKTGTVADLLRGKLGNLNRLHLSAKQASGAYRQALYGVSLALEANGSTLDQNTVFGQRNAVAIKKAASLALEHAQAVYQQTGSLKKSRQALADDRKWIEYVGTAAGLNKGQVDKLLSSMGLISKLKPHAKVTVDTATAANDVRQIQSYIDSIHGHQVVMTITTTGHANDANPGTRGDNQITTAAPAWPHNARGTSALRDGYFTVGEAGWELGRKRGSKVEIFDNKTSQKMTGMPATLPGYATGTKSAATKAATKHNENIQKIVSAAAPLLSSGHNVNATASDLNDAAKALRDAAKEVKFSAKLQAKLARESAKLSGLATRRDKVNALLGTAPSKPTAYDVLGTAQDNYRSSRDSTRTAFTGMVDATTLGQNSWGVANSSSIVSSLRTMATKAKNFAAVLKKLIKLRVPRGIVEQLAQAGPSALAQAQAFAASSPGQLNSIRSSYSAIDSAGLSAGGAVADAYFGKNVKSAQAAVNRLVKERNKLNKAIRYYVDDMVREVEKIMGIKLSPSIAQDDRARHHAGHHGGTHHGGGHKSKTEQHFHIHGVTNPEAIALAVARRLAKTVA